MNEISIMSKNLRHQITIAFMLMTILPMLVLIYMVARYIDPKRFMPEFIPMIILFAFVLGLSGFCILMSAVKAISQFGQDIAAIAAGDLTRVMPARSEGEIGKIEKSLCVILGKLNRDRLALMAMNEQLEEKVEEKTRKLKEAEAYTTNIITSMIDALVVVDQDGRVKTINRATAELLGYTEDELIGKPVAMLLAEEEVLFKPGGLRNLIKEGSVHNHALTYRTKSGEKISVSLSVSVMCGVVCPNRDKPVDDCPAFKKKGTHCKNVAGVVCVAHDMREINRLMHKEKEASRELKASEEILYNIVEMSLEGVLVRNKKGMIRFANKTAEVFLGCKREVLLNSEVNFRVLSESDTMAEVEIFRRDGMLGVGEVYHTQTMWEREEMELLMIRDITERKEREDAFRRSEKTGQLLLNAAADAAWLTDLEGTILAANQKAAGFLGISQKDLMGVSLYAVWPKNLAKPIRGQVVEAAHLRTTVRYEDQYAGTICDISVFPVLDNRGEVDRLAVFCRDITKERKVDRMKTDFVSIASHELRTPLSNIMEAVSQVVDGLYGEINEEQQMILGIAHRNCGRMGRLIHDLLDISRIESGQIVLSRRLVDLDKNIQNVCDLFKASAEEKGLHLRHETGNGIPMVFGDTDRLEQILVNLIGNAVKFTPAGGTITVETGLDDGFIQCVVSDTGAGIKPEHLQDVFEKFVTISASAHGGDSGTGLGLPIARELVQLHGGTLWAESEPGRGSRLIFRIPDYQSEAALLEYLAQQIIADEAGRAGVDLLGIRPKEWPELQARQGDVARCFLRKLRDVFVEVLDAAVNVWSLEGSGELVIVLKDHKDSLLQIRQTILHQYEKCRFAINKTSFEFGLQMEMASYPRDGTDARGLRDLLKERLFNATPFVNKPRKLLVVDDNEQTVQLLKAYLSRKAIRLLQAYSGEQALELIAQDVPDLILLDMGLPGISGYEVIARLKKSMHTSRIPVIIMTGREVDTGKIDAFQDGVPVLRKPFELNVFADHMYRILNMEEVEVASNERGT